MKKKHSIKSNMAFITILGILLSIGAVFVSTYLQLSGLAEISIRDHIKDTMINYKVEVDFEVQTAEDTAVSIAEDSSIVKAVKSGRKKTVKKAVKRNREASEVETELGGIAVTDARGNVLCCPYNAKSLAADSCVAAALKGNIVSEIVSSDYFRLGAVGASPIKNGKGKIIGAAVAMYPFDDNCLVDDIKGDTSSEYTIFSGDEILSTTLMENDKRMTGTKMDPAIADTVLSRGKDYVGDAMIAGNPYMSYYTPLYGSGEEPVGALLCGVLTKGIKNAEHSAVIAAIVVAAIAALISAMGIIIYVNRRVARPIIMLCRETEQVAHGNLNVNVRLKMNNEIGALADSIQLTVDSVRGYIDDIASNLGSMAAGDMNTEITKEYVGDFASIKVSLEKINHSLNETLSSINHAAHQVSSASEQVAQGSQSLSQGAVEQAASIEELAATVHEVADRIDENAKSAEEAMNSTNQAGSKMRSATEKMNELIGAMNEIKDCSDKIGKVIKTIEDIAFQTNILALNASVEAARSGEAGKGFAVVAGEVRNLASKSTEAASDTNLLIEDTIASINKGNGLVSQVAEVMSEVSDAAGQVVVLNTNICKSSADVVVSIQQINEGVGQISGVVQTNSATAQESAAASEELSGQANMLQEEISHFKLRE